MCAIGLAVNAYLEKPTGLRLPFPPSKVTYLGVCEGVHTSCNQTQANVIHLYTT